MIERPLEEKFRTRQDVKEHYSQEFLKLVLEDNMPFKQTLEGVIDGGYCYGYNTVLEAVEAVLSKQDYFKVIDFLHKKNC